MSEQDSLAFLWQIGNWNQIGHTSCTSRLFDEDIVTHLIFYDDDIPTSFRMASISPNWENT